MKNLATPLSTFFLGVLLVFAWLAHTAMKESAIQEYELHSQKVATYMQETLKALQIHQLDAWQKSVEGALLHPLLKGVYLEFKKLQFRDKDLMLKTNLLDESWSISDVSTDGINGEIQEIENGIYLFHPASTFKKELPLEIRFFGYKNGMIHDFSVVLGFAFSLGEIDADGAEIYKVENENLLVRYALDKSQLQKRYEEYLYLFAFAALFLLLFASLFFYLYYTLVAKKRFKNSINAMDTYIEALLQKDFQSLPEPTDKDKDFQDLYTRIKLFSQNYVNVVSELNVTRNIIEKREITDDLTGLPNKKWFEKDLKQMFVASKEGYIIFLKIDKLGEFAKKHGGDLVNSLVGDFAKTIEGYFIANKEVQGTFYRFFGAEFGMVLYENDVDKVKKVLDEIIQLTQTLDDKYYFFDNQIYFGGTPFDKYGTVESILQSAKDQYNSVYAQKQEFYKVLDISEQIEKNKEFEASVKDIIDRDDFALQYVFDTYDFSPTPNLIMQEISPMLIDMRTFERFPIGVFISVAEKMDVAMEFDKLLIKKALSHIEMAELEHLIAINLSVGSISSMRFLTWLSSTLTYEKYAASLVFVVTAYNAAANFDLFKRFVETARSFEIKIMIKRYDANDLPLEKLQELAPDFIRIEKDYCNDLKRDSVKQHAIKQVLFVADEHNIKVLGDGVRSDADYSTIERLGFYGTSR